MLEMYLRLPIITEILNYLPRIECLFLVRACSRVQEHVAPCKRRTECMLFLMEIAARDGVIIPKYEVINDYMHGALSGAARGGHIELFEYICTQDHTKIRDEYSGAFYYAAASGRIDMCRFMREHLRHVGILNRDVYDSMLRGAAFGGHEDICRLAREWGATYLPSMVSEAVYGGEKNFFRFSGLAREWGLNDADIWGNLQVIHGIAWMGMRDVCLFAIEWWRENVGRFDFRTMMDGAAESGRKDLCHDICEWSRATGATGATARGMRELYNLMLLGAARGEHVDLCLYARELGADDFRGMMLLAAACDSVSLCILAREWSVAHGSAIDNSELLVAAAYFDSEDVCRYARPLICENLPKVLRKAVVSAAVKNNVRICRLMYEWLSEVDAPAHTRQKALDRVLRVAISEGYCELETWARELRAHAS